MKIIITGATGMVGEGVLLEYLGNSEVSEILSISRKPCWIQHQKLKELIISDFTRLDDYADHIAGYDACFYCAGISSVGMSEEKFFSITYTTTLAFAQALLKANPSISFCYISGQGTDGSENGKVMWARVKGKTENALNTLFIKEFNFRPGAMLPVHGQRYAKTSYRIIAKIINFFTPSSVLTLSELARALMNAVTGNHVKTTLEVADIKALARGE